MQQRIIDIRNDSSLEENFQEPEDLDTSDENSCVSFCEVNEPTLSIILTLNQGQLEELVENLSNHLLESTQLPEFHEQTSKFLWTTKWIYALLACLRSPLDPEVHNNLRVIAKTCIQIRNFLKAQQETSCEPFLPWNLIIVVIALNFHQFDLLSL